MKYSSPSITAKLFKFINILTAAVVSTFAAGSSIARIAFCVFILKARTHRSKNCVRNKVLRWDELDSVELPSIFLVDNLIHFFICNVYIFI
jgi:hypothetical protein